MGNIEQGSVLILRQQELLDRVGGLHKGAGKFSRVLSSVETTEVVGQGRGLHYPHGKH